MQPTHTPGPWACDMERKGDRVFPFTINDADRDPVARVITRHDAALIAAAPELLEAAKDVLDKFNQTLLPVGADLADSIRVFLGAAIAKAEGRQ